MADYSLNGLPILETIVMLHRTGCWTADVITSDPAQVAGMSLQPAALSLGAMQLSGFFLREGQWRASEYARIVGGKGGLRKTAKPQGWSNAPIQTVVSSLLSSVGESLNPTVALSGSFPSWSVNAEPVSIALTRIVDAIGGDTVWRVLIDGTIWIGVDTWATATLTNATVEDIFPEQRKIQIGIVAPELLPGSTYRSDYGYGGHVSTVVYKILVDSTGQQHDYQMDVLFEDAPADAP